MKRIFSFNLVLIFLISVFTYNCFAETYNLSDILDAKIETERLILEPTTDVDLSILSEYLLEYDVVKYLYPSIKQGFQNKEEALKFLRNSDGEYDFCSEFTIKLKKDKKPIGKIDVMVCCTGGKNLVMLGYWLGKDFWKKGYAREACCKIGNKVLNAKDVKSIYIACDSQNISSAKLAAYVFDYLKQNNESLNLRIYQRDLKLEDEQKNQINMQDFIIRKEI